MNAVFCFDGTCNEPSDVDDVFYNSSISNILKTHIFCGGDLINTSHAFEQQKSFYYAGIGTYGNWLSQVFNTMFAPEYADLESIYKQAYNDYLTLRGDDHIFIFGFSRGAAIARRFASKLTEQGRKITFLGVYDTVASIGMPDLSAHTQPASDVVFENNSVSPLIHQAVHLVAIDERRIAFQPLLMAPGANVKEVWFAGVHADIGGGFWHDGLADICLSYMLEEAKRFGLQVLELHQVDYSKLSENEVSIGSDDIAIFPQIDGPLHQKARTGFMSSKTLNPRQVRVDCLEDCMPLVHYSVVERFQAIADYRPIALRNKPFQLLLPNGERSGMIFGIEGMREYSVL